MLTYNPLREFKGSLVHKTVNLWIYKVIGQNLSIWVIENYSFSESLWYN